jgi:hypothetical protein
VKGALRVRGGRSAPTVARSAQTRGSSRAAMPTTFWYQANHNRQDGAMIETMRDRSFGQTCSTHPDHSRGAALSARSENVVASIVLNDMDRSSLAAYGFRSWMLQDIQEQYEVVINLFNGERLRYEALALGRNSACQPIIRVHDKPRFFNIAAANNLGLHFSTGTYVLFANSDVIHPSNYLREFTEELRKRDICYAQGSRVNLSPERTLAFAPADSYSMSSNFDFLLGLEHARGRTIILGISPWTILRQVALDVGGFDSQILCYEDSEFNDRVLHFLRRRRLQACLFANTSLYGYHLYHGPSELYGASHQAAAILEPRRLRLLADPTSAEDIVPTNLGSLPALRRDLFDTLPPLTAAAHPSGRPRVWRGLSRRLRASMSVLIRGH